MSKIGYHINLNNLREQSKEVQENAKAVGAAFHLVMTTPKNGTDTESEIAAVDEWAKALQPAQIIWRTDSELGSNWSAYPSNDEIIIRWLDEERPQYIRHDPSHNPSLEGDDRSMNVLYVNSRADLLNKATAIGIKVAVGAFHAGTPPHDLIADGTYDDLIRAVVEGGHYFSVHEYCPGIPGAGDIFPYEKLLEPNSIIDVMKAEQWPTQSDYKLLRRSDHLVMRARELGLSDPQIIVTESFVDLIPHANEVISQLKDKYGIPAYNKDLRGILAWRMYYADAFPEKPFAEVVTQLSKYIEENIYYPEYIKGVCLYSLDWEQDTPKAHNFLDPFLDNFRQSGLPNLGSHDSILTKPTPPPPSESDTISTRSPEFWAKVREAVAEMTLDEAIDISEDSTADGIPVSIQDSSRDVQADSDNNVHEETGGIVRASSTIEIPAVALGNMGSRWQEGTFHSEGVRIRVAPFTDAEPIGLLSGEKAGHQHVGEIQSDGYSWRWVRYLHDEQLVEGYAASAFYEFKLG